MLPLRTSSAGPGAGDEDSEGIKDQEPADSALCLPCSGAHRHAGYLLLVRGKAAADLQSCAGTGAAAARPPAPRTVPRGNVEGDAQPGARQPGPEHQPEGPRHARGKH